MTIIIISPANPIILPPTLARRDGKESIHSLSRINFDIAADERSSSHIIVAYRCPRLRTQLWVWAGFRCKCNSFTAAMGPFDGSSQVVSRAVKMQQQQQQQQPPPLPKAERKRPTAARARERGRDRPKVKRKDRPRARGRKEKAPKVQRATARQTKRLKLLLKGCG